VWSFVQEFGKTMGKTIETISPAALERLQQHPWAGNIRELRNVIERAMILSTGPTLQVELPSPPQAPHDGGPTMGMTLEEVERRHIRAVLEKTGWKVSGPRGAAILLGLKPTTLESRMARLGIKRERS